MRFSDVKQLYYITHVRNVPSILKHSILSHERVEREGIEYYPIYDAEIVERRKEIRTPDGRVLWNFANLYFQARNAMLYRVVTEKNADEIAVLAVSKDILKIKRSDLFISTGNAASVGSNILPKKEGLAKIDAEVLNMEYWKVEDGSKRKMMAECLVPDSVPFSSIETIYVASHRAAEQVKAEVPHTNIPIIPEPHLFFQPFRKINLTTNLSLIEGDMLFSRLHTLTISVNTVGIMGKGLASRAKYQFPDVYVFYQDLCRKKILRMGKPYLYKRESSFDYELADEPSTLSNANSETWFLLFPTKHHWRERGDIHGIEEGLQWLVANYKSEGIQSLALPALGCGLGWLEWHEVGPLLYRYLSTLEIPVWIYLPREKTVPDQELTKEFLEREGLARFTRST
jgi:hypothetical protein